MIVELDTLPAFRPLGIPPTLGSYTATHHRAREPLVGGAENLRHGEPIPGSAGIIEKRSQASPIQPFGNRHPRKSGDRRIDVDELDNPGAGSSIPPGSRSSDDQRRPGRLLKQGSLLPDTLVLTQWIAMVAPDNDNRIFSQLEPIKRGQQTSDLRIDKGNTGIIGLEGLQ